VRNWTTGSRPSSCGGDACKRHKEMRVWVAHASTKEMKTCKQAKNVQLFKKNFIKGYILQHKGVSDRTLIFERWGAFHLLFAH